MHLGGEDGAGAGAGFKTADPLAGLCDTLTPGLPLLTRIPLEG